MIAVIFHIMGEGTKKARKLFSRSQAFLDKIASVFFFFSIKETFFCCRKKEGARPCGACSFLHFRKFCSSLNLTIGVVGLWGFTVAAVCVASTFGCFWGRGSIFAGWHALVWQIQDLSLSKRGDLVIRRKSL